MASPEDGKSHPLTLALLCKAMATALKTGCATATQAETQLRFALSELIHHPQLDPASRIHPYILFNVLDALDCLSHADASAAEELKEKLIQVTREETTKLLSKKAIEDISPAELVALGFCSVILSGFGEIQDQASARLALSACLESQDSSGCWPFGWVMTHHSAGSETYPQISTYEVGWAVVRGARQLWCRGNANDQEFIRREVLPKAISAASYIQKSAVHVSGGTEPHLGWCSDHVYGTRMIESWTSALVIDFAREYVAFVDELNSNSALKTFSFQRPGDVDWPSYLAWSTFLIEGEVDSKSPILTYIDKEIIRPILNHPQQVPPINGSSNSLLLFGPPGTSKTTIVKAIAGALSWPIVSLSPGDFVDRGLDLIESQSRVVFDRLGKLRKTVVLFDECDELFRDRQPSSENEQSRNITAFLTACMLPKLQQLHDSGRIVFVVCTNHLESMDSAVCRGGRMDHLVAVGPPDLEARKRIIQKAHKQANGSDLKTAFLEQAALCTERFVRPELVRFAKLVAAKKATNFPAAKKLMEDISTNMAQGLTISELDFQQFTKDLRDYSHPHLNP